MDLNKKIYLSSAIFLTIGFLFIIFLIYPTFNNIKESSEKLLFQKNSLFSLIKTEESLRSNESFYNLYKKDLEKIDKLFVDPDVPIEFIKFLEETAEKFQLNIEASSLSVADKGNDFWRSSFFSISTKGFFSDSLKFLEKIENSSYLIEITNLKLSSSKSKENEINLSFSIKVFSQ